MLPPRVWGESTEPQNIARVRQNKAPMCARCNNLQCLPCHPKLLEHTMFQPCLPTCLPVGERCLLLLTSRAGAGSGVSSFLLKCVSLHPAYLQGHGQTMLTLVNCGGLHELCGFSETFWGLLTVPSSTGEIGHCQQASQAHETPQGLTGAFSWGRNQPPRLELGGNFSLPSRLAGL